ncbi:reverse transcriptase domain-containing protein [Tanacetum coccineum]
MLRCVEPLQANYTIREVHEGACGMHLKARCDSCQIHAPVPRRPKTRLTSIMSPWPFYQWGRDILGPLPEGPNKLKFIIVAIDYFTKWIKANPLVKTTSKELVNDPFKSWCEKWKIRQVNTAVAHPQANDLVERANKSLMHSLKARLGRERTIQFNEAQNKEDMRLNLDLIQERREAATIQEAKYKKKVEQYYNKRVHPVSFRVRDFIYRRNEASRVENQGKLGLN